MNFILTDFFADLDLVGILSRSSPFSEHRKSEHFCFRNKKWPIRKRGALNVHGWIVTKTIKSAQQGHRLGAFQRVHAGHPAPGEFLRTRSIFRNPVTGNTFTM
jgi:hypothetical protein